jgi:octaprenyl-diphosphate synthase
MNRVPDNGQALLDPSQSASVLSQVEALVGSELRDVDEIFREELRSPRQCVTDVLQHVTRFQGKRLRPILVLLTADACGGVRHAHKVLGAVVEMIHMATLVHDDVLDDADTRRHVATVNSRWNNETSVLFGDYLFTHAFHLASSLETAHACRVIGRATNLVCEGELSQVHERGNLGLTEDEYLQIITGKTAELCAVSCYLGAHYAGMDDAVSRSLEQYGRSLGIAFQIADDILDLMGNEAKTGKTLGSDIEKQKLTLPLIRLLDQSSPEESREIRGLLARPEAATRRTLQKYLDASDALEYADERARHFVADARRQLECLPDTPAKRLLDEIAEFSIRRKF